MENDRLLFAFGLQIEQTFSAYLCGPLRLCGDRFAVSFTAEAQRTAEIRREEINVHWPTEQ